MDIDIKNTKNLLIELANNVYKTLGRGLALDIYTNAFLVELRDHEIQYELNKTVSIFYGTNNEFIGSKLIPILIHHNDVSIALRLEVVDTPATLNKHLLQIEPLIKWLKLDNPVSPFVIHFVRDQNHTGIQSA